jgi:1,6-anhydro-N-acetylmuramate kinase
VTIETVRECELANESGTGTAAAKLPHRETSIARCWTREPYHRRQPLKSAGREQYGVEFIGRLRQSGAPRRDLIATAAGLTAATIAVAVQRAAPGSADLIASGGGIHNARIMAHRAGFLPEGGYLHLHRSRRRRRRQGGHCVRRPGARDMAPEAVEPAFGHGGQTVVLGKHYALNP